MRVSWVSWVMEKRNKTEWEVFSLFKPSFILATERSNVWVNTSTFSFSNSQQGSLKFSGARFVFVLELPVMEVWPLVKQVHQCIVNICIPKQQDKILCLHTLWITKHWQKQELSLQCHHSWDHKFFPRCTTWPLRPLFIWLCSKHSSLYETVCAWVCVCIYIFMNSTWSPPLFHSSLCYFPQSGREWRDERREEAKEGRTSVSSELSPALFFISFHPSAFQRDWTIKESNH